MEGVGAQTENPNGPHFGSILKLGLIFKQFGSGKVRGNIPFRIHHGKGGGISFALILARINTGFKLFKIHSLLKIRSVSDIKF